MNAQPLFPPPVLTHSSGPFLPEPRSRVKVEVAVLGSPSLTVLSVVSVDAKQHSRKTTPRVQELRESRGGRPGLPVPNSPCGLCGRNDVNFVNSNRFFSRSPEGIGPGWSRMSDAEKFSSMLLYVHRDS